MKDTYVIGIHGRAGSGKDTLANMLGYACYAFAKPIKDALAAMGFPEPQRRADKELECPGFRFTWRRAAQTLGTEWGRALQSDIWLAMAKRYHEEIFADFLVITDVRFHNEADWVRDNGLLVHLRGRATSVAGEARQHESENELPFMIDDYMILNGGTVNDLQCKAHDLQEHIANR